jgi:uncharacterized protein YjbI with pentapeptide repeats
VDLNYARLEGAKLIVAHLTQAQLIAAHLEQAVLLGANLKEANLIDAHLQGATLDLANLDGAKLGGNHLERVDLCQVKGLTLDASACATRSGNHKAATGDAMGRNGSSESRRLPN